MDMAFEQKIRERAYGMWLEAGMAHGMAHEHWLSAEEAVKGELAKPVKTRAKAAATRSDMVVSATAKVKAPTKPKATKAAAKPKAKTTN